MRQFYCQSDLVEGPEDRRCRMVLILSRQLWFGIKTVGRRALCFVLCALYLVLCYLCLRTVALPMGDRSRKTHGREAANKAQSTKHKVQSPNYQSMPTAIVHHPVFKEHDTGFNHPESPSRYAVVMDALRG